MALHSKSVTDTLVAERLLGRQWGCVSLHPLRGLEQFNHAMRGVKYAEQAYLTLKGLGR